MGTHVDVTDDLAWLATSPASGDPFDMGVIEQRLEIDPINHPDCFTAAVVSEWRLNRGA